MNLLQIHEPGQTPLPHAGNAAIGIDLGTTHCVAAVSVEGKPNILRDICGGALVPSVVYYAADGTIEVGKNARHKLQEGSREVVASIKRLMGRSGEDARALHMPYSLTADMVPRIVLGARKLTAVEISADLLRHMKSLAQTALGHEVTQAVITVPAYFDDGARQATKDAARLAGLEVLRLINEPTAAALAYGLDSKGEGVYAVYDLGGGTFDVSILKLEKGVFQVLATGGNLALGGDDLDRIFAKLCGLDETDDALLNTARAAREKLSNSDEVTLNWQGKSHNVSRGTYEQAIAGLVQKTLDIAAQALESASVSAGDIEGVVLVGGVTRTPYIRREVETFFGRPPLAGINPDEVVAAGAAIAAEGLTRGSDNLLLDVVPLSLGLETMGGIVEKIILRNTPIPTAHAQEFTTYQDGQTAMIIHVVQGEREMVAQNRSLARFDLAGIPPLPAGIARVRVTFTVDADGLLSVSAREQHTGVEQTVSVKPSYGLAEGEIERMLLESMQFAKEDILERLLREAASDAKRSIEEVKSALKVDGDLLSAEQKARIDRQMKAVWEAAEGDDRDRIDAEVEQLHAFTRDFAEKRMDRAINSALKGAHVNTIVEN